MSTVMCQQVSIEDTVDSDNDFVTMWITELGQHRYQPTTPWGLRMWQGTVVDLHQYPSLRLRNWHLPDERICNSCPPDQLRVSEELCTWHEHSTVRQTYKPRMFASKKRAARLGRKAHKKWVALCKKRAGRSAQEVTW